MRTSDTIVKISEAFCLAQSEFVGAKKDAENPFFKSHYADMASVIESIKPAFTKYGLCFIQGTAGSAIMTRIIHKSGEWYETTYPLQCKDPANPQSVAAAVTYAKRNALQAAVGVPSIDDDGETAVDRNNPAPALEPKLQELKKENESQFRQKFVPPPSVQARAAAAPKPQMPLFPKVVEGSSDLGSYIIKFGKHKDTMLNDMDIFALDGYIKWLKESSAKSGKPMANNAAELCEVGEAYLKSRMGGNTENERWSTNQAPGIDEEESLPF